MEMVDPAVLKKHRAIEGLMIAIFGRRADSRLPICYPYILTDNGEALYLDKIIQEILESLPKSKGDRDSEEWNRLRRVLELRFGLIVARPLTLQKVADRPEFGVTRERISEMEAKALRTLRHPSCSKFRRQSNYCI